MKKLLLGILVFGMFASVGLASPRLTDLEVREKVWEALSKFEGHPLFGRFVTLDYLEKILKNGGARDFLETPRRK